MKTNYRIAYFDEVENDIAEAKAWYKAVRKGLDKQFAKAIKEAIKKLQKVPAAHAIRYRNIRIAYPAIFPYAIHFYIDKEESLIVIIAIIHANRNANDVRNRIS